MILRMPSVACLYSTLGMHPQRYTTEDMGKLTEKNLVIRAIHVSAVTHVDYHWAPRVPW